MKKIYISGRIAGLSIEQAAEQFAAAEAEITKQGHQAINPMKLPHNHGETWEDYMREDLTAMLKCNAIYMLSDWERSRGATLEKYLAEELGFEIIYQ